MTGSTQQDYAAMMLAGGRSVEGNRSRSGKNVASKSLGAAGRGKSGAGKRQARSKSKSKTKSAKRK
jgi:hypothetical protein